MVATNISTVTLLPAVGLACMLAISAIVPNEGEVSASANIPSSAHRLMMTNMAMQLAQNAPPGMFNME